MKELSPLHWLVVLILIPVLFFFPFMVPLMGVVLILVASTLRSDQRKRWQDLVTAIAYIAFIGVGLQMDQAFIRIFPRTLDSELLRADHRLFFDPISFAHAISRHNLAMSPLIIGYTFLPAVIGAAWVAEQDHGARRAVIIGGVFCWVFYAIFPAVGPAHYDWSLGTASQLSPRNCMPSMHLTWAILIAWNARTLPFRILLWAYAALTAVATIAVGEHYLIDLIAAIPYAAVIQLASSLLASLTQRAQAVECE